MHRTLALLVLSLFHGGTLAQESDPGSAALPVSARADGGGPEHAGTTQRVTQAGTRRALLVGIEDYPRTSGWPVLRGPRADVALFRRALLERAGFEARNVHTLFDRDATKAGILAALRALAASAEPDDLLLFYFAGHGSQVPDQQATDGTGAGDENDGLDETLIPFDPFAPDGGPNDLRDDEVSEWIRFANRYTANVVLVFDCCSSGTNVRGEQATARFVAPEVRGIGGKRKPARAEGSGYLRPAADLSYVSLAACRASESAFEVRFLAESSGRAPGALGSGVAPGDRPEEDPDHQETVHGLFTHTLVREMYRNVGRTSYASLLDRVRHEVRRHQPQTPVAEGRLDQGVAFAGGLAVRPFSFELRDERANGDSASKGPRVPVLEAGAVDGLAAGAILQVFPDAAAVAAGTPLGRVRLIDVQPTRSHGVWLGAPPEPRDAASALWRAVIEQPAPTRSRLLVGISEALDQDANDALAEAFAASPLVELVRRPGAPRALTVRRESSGDEERWRVVDAAGSPLPLAARVAQGTSAELASWLAGLARARSMQRDLVRENVPGLPVDASLEQLDANGASLGTPARDASGRWRMRAGDVLQSTLTNLGTRPIYASLLVIAPDGEVALVQRPFSEDELLAPGGSVRSPALRLTMPAGNEPFYRDEAQTFRWIVTTRVHDLRHLEQAACNDAVLRTGASSTTPEVVDDSWRTASFAVLVEAAR